MDFNPRLNQFELGGFYFSFHDFSIRDSYNSLLPAILNVDMRRFVFGAIEVEHADNNAIKH